MKHVTVGEIAEAVDGNLLCGNPGLEIENVSIDSRKMKGNDIFVPIIGAKVDAHRFIPNAFEAGAAATFTSEHSEADDGRHPWIRVGDTVQALQALGGWYRGFFSGPVIGITGSVGKTTTREMVTAALASERSVTGTKGNSNSQVGVPLSLTEMDLTAETAVFEMGMSFPGEMERLAAIVRPTAAIVTNIGVSHIENLGSRENICREKMHITDGFGREQLVILNGDDDLLSKYRGTGRFRTVFYGVGPDNDLRAENIRVEGERTCFDVVDGNDRMPMSLGVPGTHNVMNALAALAAADAFGVDRRSAAAALEEFRGFDRRLQIEHTGGYTYIDDTYNASPASMRAALQVLGTVQTEGRRIAVLADMLELGPDAPRFHYETGVYGASLPVDRVYVIGKLAENIGRAYEEKGVPVEYCSGNDDAVRRVLAYRQPGDAILLKGSNGMHLGEVLRELKENGVR